jgi:hypothetical protein
MRVLLPALNSTLTSWLVSVPVLVLAVIVTRRRPSPFGAVTTLTGGRGAQGPGVAVGVGGANVGVAVRIGGVAVLVAVGVGVAVGFCPGVGVSVGVARLIAVPVGVSVAPPGGVPVGVGVAVPAGVPVGVGVAVSVGVAVDVGVPVTVGVAVNVGVTVIVGVSVCVGLGVIVGVAVSVAVLVGVGVFVALLTVVWRVALLGVVGSNSLAVTVATLLSVVPAAATWTCTVTSTCALAETANPPSGQVMVPEAPTDGVVQLTPVGGLIDWKPTNPGKVSVNATPVAALGPLFVTVTR